MAIPPVIANRQLSEAIPGLLYYENDVIYNDEGPQRGPIFQVAVAAESRCFDLFLQILILPSQQGWTEEEPTTFGAM